MQVGPCIPVGIQLQKDEVGPTSGPTWCLSHFVEHRVQHEADGDEGHAEEEEEGGERGDRRRVEDAVADERQHLNEDGVRSAQNTMRLDLSGSGPYILTENP